MAAPKTVLTYPLDGTLKDFTIPFEYLARKFIIVTLIGSTRRPLVLNSEYRFTSKTTINTTSAWGPTQGFNHIELRRVTSATDRLVDFSDGSILRAYDLNTSQIQSLHIAEEARDLTADTIGVNNNGDLDARGRRIVNVADAIDPGDTVTLRQEQAWGQSASNQAAAAAMSAAAAETSNQQSHTNNVQSYQNLVETNTSRDQAAASAAASQASNLQATEQQAEATHQAGLSFNSATASEASRQLSVEQASKATTEADRATFQADRAKTEADKLGNFNGLAATIDSTSGIDVVWKGTQGAKGGAFVSRNDVEANFTFAKADGSDPIRFVRTADRAVHLYDNANGARIVFQGNGNTHIQRDLLVLGTSQLNGRVTFNGDAMGNGAIDALNSFGVRSSGNSNCHLWFYNQDKGVTRGVIYAGADNSVRVQAGNSLAARWSADGSSNFNQIGTSGIENQGRVASHRNGVLANPTMYSNCHFLAQTLDGTPPAYGFHRGGQYGFALWQQGSELAIMDSGGTNRSVVTNGNLGNWVINNLYGEAVGGTSSLLNVSGTYIGLNGQLAGGNLRYATHNHVASAPPGTWRNQGVSNNGGVSNWMRVA